MMNDTRHISRRAFHCRAAGGALAACASLRITDSSAAEKKFPDGRYFDMHTHLGQPWNRRGKLSAEMLLRWMDAHKIAQAVVLPLISPEAWFYPITTDYVLTQTKPFRDRLIPFCAIDPRTGHLDHRGKVDILKRYIDAGAKGFGEHKVGLTVDDARNIALYKACAEAKLPVLFHLDNVRNTDKPGLPGLEKVLKAVPEGVFIGHGPGWWASISRQVTQAELGGYPKGEVIAGGAIDRLMGKYPNIYGELSAGSGANSILRDMKFGREFLLRRADRIMFGTDYLAKGQGVPQFELFDRLKLPVEVEAKILRNNARRVLRLA
jgi:predicted TIM-barrel fold metal-dependent hydrolase